ncbi:hypothetical protein ON010_g7137 [Phytophthora cinnamomi]|nr:hypothetical protein ON010_g7137 [Phytophthora cinnamomi]
MSRQEQEDPILAVLRGEDLEKSEEDLRAFLNTINAKELRSACTMLRLGAQRRDSGQDNKIGYVNLLWEFYKDKCDSVLAALEGPRVIVPTAKPTKHCRFRLLNVVFSDEFVHRMGEAGQIPNADSPYWVDVAEAYNNDQRHYNCYTFGSPRSVYDGVEPAIAALHSRAKLKSPVHKRRFGNYCDGHVDALYMEDWLTIREDRREQIVGMLSAATRMTTLSSSSNYAAEPSQQDSSYGRPPKRCRNLTTAERILERMEKDREEERTRERLREEKDQEEERARVRLREEASTKDKYSDVMALSAAVQAAFATLNAFKVAQATPDLIEGTECVVNKLISRWKQAAEKATRESNL